jgi:hypothetical protein
MISLTILALTIESRYKQQAQKAQGAQQAQEAQ